MKSLVLPPAKRPQSTLAAPQPRSAKRAMKMKVLTDDLTEGSSVATDTLGPLVTSTDSHALLHDAGQHPPEGGTDLFMPVVDSQRENPSDGSKDEDKARTTTIGSSQGDQMKDGSDIEGGGSNGVEAIGHTAATDSPQPPQLPEGDEDDGLLSSVKSRALTSHPAKPLPVVLGDLMPKSLEAPPRLSPSAPSEITTSQPAVGFGKGLGRSIDFDRQSAVSSPPLPQVSGDTTAPKQLQVFSRSSMKGSRGPERGGSVMMHLDR